MRRHTRGPVLSAVLAALPLTAQEPAVRTNTLLIVADDVGVDSIATYRIGSSPPPTPNLDRLAREGVLFRSAWANPACSPTRATILTGRYGFRTGVTWVVCSGGQPLLASEATLPEVLAAGGYTSALFGKWHLTDATSGDRGPNLAGFTHFAGHLGNIREPEGYSSWRRVVDGGASTCRRYATTQCVDDAIAWIRVQPTPWLCCVCFHAAHEPFHAPPAHLHSRELAGRRPSRDAVDFYKAMVEAMDAEIGRLLRALGEDREALARTHVVFVGDNGTPREVSEPPFRGHHGKLTLFEGGVRVPLIVRSPAVRVPGREVRALVNTVDLFATVAELSGVDPRAVVPRHRPLDGVSLVPYLGNPDRAPLREFAYAEIDSGDRRGGRAIRDDRFKLIRWDDGSEALFDLEADPFERRNLRAGWQDAGSAGGADLAQRRRYRALASRLERLIATSLLPRGR